MTCRVAVIGAGGFGREVSTMLGSAGFLFAGYIDSREADVSEEALLGDDTVLPTLCSQGIEAVCVAIGNTDIRKRLFSASRSCGLRLISLVHPASTVLSEIRPGEGVIVYPQAVIMNGVSLREGCVVNAGATLGHDAKIGAFANISPGVHLGGHVQVGDQAMLGIGCSVKEKISIGERAVVGAGSVVVRDVEPGVTAYGVPARSRSASK
jgi:sugar O-acyltransferase (sialic acid O-acetyltransferase NeuD family)